MTLSKLLAAAATVAVCQAGGLDPDREARAEITLTNPSWEQDLSGWDITDRMPEVDPSDPTKIAKPAGDPAKMPTMSSTSPKDGEKNIMFEADELIGKTVVVSQNVGKPWQQQETRGQPAILASVWVKVDEDDNGKPLDRNARGELLLSYTARGQGPAEVNKGRRRLLQSSDGRGKDRYFTNYATQSVDYTAKQGEWMELETVVILTPRLSYTAANSDLTAAVRFTGGNGGKISFDKFALSAIDAASLMDAPLKKRIPDTERFPELKYEGYQRPSFAERASNKESTEDDGSATTIIVVCALVVTGGAIAAFFAMKKNDPPPSGDQSRGV